jgi:hypothetical protein
VTALLSSTTTPLHHYEGLNEMCLLWQEVDPVRTVENGQAEVAVHLVPFNGRAAD